MSGTLDRDNAPALPWVDGIEQVELTGHRSDSTTVDVWGIDPECTCPPESYPSHEEGCSVLVGPRVTETQRAALEQAVREALNEAWSAGEREAEYKTGPEWARQKADEYQFTENGELYD